MEYLKARLETFQVPKQKRTKASSSKQATASSPKWPHPPTWKATPDSLAEAGFYFTPSSRDPDNVTCYMCGKHLCNWEPEDDPFEIHYEKCGDVCAWAIVRCQNPGGSGSVPDTTRHPTSKAMEKARLDTFAKVEWPHDGVKGHGANSRALAKAGFVWNATDADDDTATCMYCNISLSGWDEEDDPYQEHLKRDKKLNTGCAFLKARAAGSLGKSTSKKAPSKAASKPTSRSASQTVKKVEAEFLPDESDDEPTATPPSGARPSTEPNGRVSKSRPSRASSAPAKTPASRRSTRGASANGKTPGSKNTVSSEVEETDVGSESETGKRVSKSKRKTGAKTRARVSAIAEEEVEEVSAPVDEDVEMYGEDEEPPVKKKRGRPPKNTAASKPALKAKSRKTTDAEVAGDAADTEPDGGSSLTPPKKAHARTRSKANMESESEAPIPSNSKSTHTRSKSTSKIKIKQDMDEEGPPVPAPAPAPKRKGKQKVAPAVVDDEDDDIPVLPPKVKGKGVIVSRTGTRIQSEGSEPDGATVEQDEPRNRSSQDAQSTSRAPKASSKRTPSLSDDAGYATAEAPADVDQMEVDEELQILPAQDMPPKVASDGTQAAPQQTASRSTPQIGDAEAGKRPSPTLNGIGRESSVPSSRASSTRPLVRVPSQRVVNKDSLRVIEIDSDGEEAASPALPPPKPKPKAVGRAVSVNGMKKPASKTSGKKLQVEVVMSTKARAPQPLPEDVAMQEPPPVSPVRAKVDRSLDSPQIVTGINPPGTPVSAVHRSAQVSPARPMDEDPAPAAEDEPVMEPVAAASTSPRTYHPVLAQVSIEKLMSLTEEEADMTLEQYIRRETELQYAQFKADAESRIEEFKKKAAEARKLIETS
ncbi:hypothetical protein C8Q79DRAFT_909095 [Trametes meyenii]|nr:hypothetical protein C8Q79DRAFT_909095 [Trametes meyenii]